MLALKIGVVVFAATLVLAPAATFADQGGQPNSHAKTNTHAHPNPNKADPQPTKGNDGNGNVMTPCDSCSATPATPATPRVSW
jgi:hypothetical protein